MKLADPFNQVRTNILMMEDLPNASLAYRLLLQEERHHNMSKIASQPTDSIAFSAEKFHDKGYNSTRTTTGFRTHRPAHVFGAKRTNHSYYCEHCHMNGHTVDRCYKLHGYPSKNRSHYSKRVAALATDVDVIENEDVENTGLSMDQFNQLCMLLGKKEVPQEPTPLDSVDTPSTANVAGNFCLPSTFTHDTSIIDNGASNHMCNSS